MPLLNLPIDDHGHMICMDNLGGFVSCENTLECRTETYKSTFIPYKQVSGGNVMVITNDIECPILSYYVIYYEKFQKMSCSEQRT